VPPACVVYNIFCTSDIHIHYSYLRERYYIAGVALLQYWTDITGKKYGNFGLKNG
jgi:hypothetical protein